MADGATSDNAAVQAQLDRLNALSPGRDILGLERIAALLDALERPQDRLPPVFHVAGTNGKGSTCAFLRAAIEASGQTAHVYTSPHLVRFNERIRVAGKLIEDDALAKLLAKAMDAAQTLWPQGNGASFFEVTTAAAFLGFAQTPADACIIEVGLGGRLDATNVVPSPASTGIASLGLDHEAFLLAPERNVPQDKMERIAFEKAGIAKSGCPLILQKYTREMMGAIAVQAMQAGAPVRARGEDWDAVAYEGKLHYRDAAGGFSLPLPRMAGAHQADNAALAIAMLRHQDAVPVSEAAFAAAMEWADWPARLQPLADGPLASTLETPCRIWLDGGHNRDAGLQLGDFFAAPDVRLHLVIGMLANKDTGAIVEPLLPRLASLTVVPVPGHECHGPEAFAKMAGDLAVADAPDIAAALSALRPQPGEEVLIGGSLYLAGEALRANDQLPE